MKNTIHTQFGISATADFEENTWTFVMPNKYAVCAGEFALVDKELYDALMKSISDLLLDKNEHSPLRSKIMELTHLMKTERSRDGKI